MTAIRVSGVYSPEQTLGNGGTGTWYRFPTGLTVDYTPSNNLQEYREIGNKYIDRAVGGTFSGSGSVKFKLDYQCIAILAWYYDGYTYDSASGTHILTNANNKRPHSLALRFKKLNRIVGGTNDETTTLLGCVPKDIQFGQSGRNATLDATISFDYVDEVQDRSPLEATDWDTYYEDESGCVPMEWACLTIGDEQVAYTESVSMTVSNGLGMIRGCGSRFNQNYQVGGVNITVSTQCYSFEPTIYYTRMYSGGSTNNDTRPKSKGLRPIPLMKIKSGITEDNTNYSMTVNLYDVYVNGVGRRDYSPDTRINDNPSLKVTKYDVRIVNKTKSKITIWDFPTRQADAEA